MSLARGQATFVGTLPYFGTCEEGPVKFFTREGENKIYISRDSIGCYDIETFERTAIPSSSRKEIYATASHDAAISKDFRFDNIGVIDPKDYRNEYPESTTLISDDLSIWFMGLLSPWDYNLLYKRDDLIKWKLVYKDRDIEQTFVSRSKPILLNVNNVYHALVVNPYHQDEVYKITLPV